MPLELQPSLEKLEGVDVMNQHRFRPWEWVALSLLWLGLQTLGPGTVRAADFVTLTDRQLMGFEKPPGMVRDPESGQWGQREAMQAYWRMKKKARKAGFEIVLVSGRRSFGMQRSIWNRKWEQSADKGVTHGESVVRTIMRYTNVPGFSRPHWGTDFDISETRTRARTGDPLVADRSAGFYQWLEENAPSFGFCRPYRGQGAVANEPWHWSYMRSAVRYDEQMDRLVDPRKIRNCGVMGEAFLEKHFRQVFREQQKSVCVDCRSIYEEHEESRQGKGEAH